METSLSKPAILITGASGFIGRHLIPHLCPDYTIFAFARRNQKEVGIAAHPQLEWYLVDLMNAGQLEQAFLEVSNTHRLDFIIHLAAYYDFGDQKYSELYEKTNIRATQILLNLARKAHVNRFIFTSSLVASNFPEAGDCVNEESPTNADFPYAITKRKGESLVREASQYFPCSIVRLSAVYSDWCEYEPLYNFLKIWLSDRWDARMLPGQGTMAIPYIHISCIVTLFDKILKKSADLGNFSVFLASSDKPVSLLELFSLATHHFYGSEKSPVFLPVWFARFGVFTRDLWGRVIGTRPFEKGWMLNYVDRQFPTDCSYTRSILDWQPKARHHITRRLLHIMENLKTRPDEWHRMNIDRLRRFERNRPSLALSEEMMRLHEFMVEDICMEVMRPENKHRFRFYQGLDPEDLRWDIDVLYNHLLTSVRHGDRSIMLTFASDLSHRRKSKQVSLVELCDVLILARDIITQGLYNNPKLTSMKMLIHDYITLAIQMALDEIKDIYENIPR